MPGSGHGWLGSHPDVHVRMVQAWIEGLRLPAELIPEPPETATQANDRRDLQRESANVSEGTR